MGGDFGLVTDFMDPPSSLSSFQTPEKLESLSNNDSYNVILDCHLK
jgi:hypothetical protein